MATESSPLLPDVAEDQRPRIDPDDVYARFGKGKKQTIVFIVSLACLVSCECSRRRQTAYG